MESKKFRFAVISHSAELGDLATRCSDPETDELQIIAAEMEEAVPVARRLLDEGVEAILSGWGTAGLLIREIGQPVVNIQTTYLDIISALLKARERSSFVGLTTFGYALSHLDVLEGLLSIKIRNVVFNSTPELVDGIKAAQAEGVRVIVGGSVCKEIVESMGGEGIILLPTEEDIRQAFQEARAVAETRRKKREEALLLRTVLETIADGVIVFDDSGRISLCNKVACDIAGIDAHACEGLRIADLLDALGVMQVLGTGIVETDRIRRLGGKDVIANSIPIVVNGGTRGLVTTLKESASIPRIERNLREKFDTHGFVARATLDHIRTKSERMQELLERAAKYAATDVSLLIAGETGTGKEIFAQGIHNISRRRDQVFVAVDCSVLPESLLESELFGYEEGAFTGARKGGKPGLFELAHGGTIFLDEIADISPALQVKLLRVIEEKEVMRIGGDQTIPVDVRIVSSTYKDLMREIRNGRFRSDLYYRLATLTLVIPPLRERPEDLPILIDEYLHKYGKGTKKIPRRLLKAIKDYEWPGNIRELDSLIQRYVILLGAREHDDDLLLSLLDELRASYRKEQPAGPEAIALPDIGRDTLKNIIRDYEGRVIEQILKDTRFSKKEAARRLGISFNTLWRKMNRYRPRQE